MTTSISDARVDQMLRYMHAFQRLPGRWDEGEKGRVHALFKRTWDTATVPERQRYQATILREVRERHQGASSRAERAPVRQPAPVTDLARRPRIGQAGERRRQQPGRERRGRSR